MRVIEFKAEAEKLGIPIIQVAESFERGISSGEILGVITANKTELISYESIELENLITEISSGKSSLANIAEQLNLSVYQVHAIAEHLIRIGRINGELTYISFNSNRWAKKEKLQKAVAHKRAHRLSMKLKRK